MKNPLRHIFTASEQRILLTLISLAAIGLALKAAKIAPEVSQEFPDSLDVTEDYQIQYDLQSITKSELISIPGIGPKRAADILAYREKYGFIQLSDLKKVKGIGDATFQRIAPYFYPLDATTHFCRESTDSLHNDGFPIDVNRASEKDLTRLSGIGPSRARLIIALRDSLGGFSQCEELLQIKGIGPKTLEKIRPNIIVGEKK